MDASTCHIVGAAPVRFEVPDIGEGDLLIAADGGYAACLAAGLEPDLVIGDFDSLEGGASAAGHAAVVELPCAKDDTDLLAAVRIGLERGYRSFALHCALGGDLGHTAAVIRNLAWLREQGCDACAVGAGQMAMVVVPDDGLVALDSWAGDLPLGCRVDVFAFGGDAHGVVERGLVWELDGATLKASDSIGVSNEVASSCPAVGVGEGRLLVIIG